MRRESPGLEPPGPRKNPLNVAKPPARPAQQQACAQRFLERAQLRAQGGVADAEAPARAHQAAFLGDDPEVVEMVVVQVR